MYMDARTNIYIRPSEKVKIMRKAQRMGITMSKLLVMAALDYDILNEEERELK